MKRFVSALAAGALALTPLAAAQAQTHGGHGFSGGFHGSGGHGFHGGFHGGFGGFRGGFRGGFYPGFAPLYGFGFGLGLASPWYDGCGLYGGGCYGPWGWYGPYDYYDDGPPPPAPPPGATSPPPVCGSWTWRADQNRYVWVTGPCPAQPAAPPQ